MHWPAATPVVAPLEKLRLEHLLRNCHCHVRDDDLVVQRRVNVCDGVPCQERVHGSHSVSVPYHCPHVGAAEVLQDSEEEARNTATRVIGRRSDSHPLSCGCGSHAGYTFLCSLLEYVPSDKRCVHPLGYGHQSWIPIPRIPRLRRTLPYWGEVGSAMASKVDSSVCVLLYFTANTRLTLASFALAPTMRHDGSSTIGPTSTITRSSESDAAEGTCDPAKQDFLRFSCFTAAQCTVAEGEVVTRPYREPTDYTRRRL